MKTRCIFIIEDNKVFRKITKQVLENNLKERIVSFQSAEEAITALEIYNPDLILLDYKLNSRSADNMSGLEFLKKKGKKNKERAVIVMSGQQDKNVTTNLLKSGAVNYLQKEDETFFEHLVIEVKEQLSILQLQKNTAGLKHALRKQALRLLLFVVLPLTIITLISISK